MEYICSNRFTCALVALHAAFWPDLLLVATYPAHTESYCFMKPSRMHQVCFTAALFVHILLLVGLSSQYAPTMDEPAHLAAGYRIWNTGRQDLYVVNPPLVKCVAAFPLLFLRPNVDWSGISDEPGYRDEFHVGEKFLKINLDRPWLLMLSRWACIPFSLIGGIVVFKWAREVFGATSGWISLFLWVFDPNVLGNGCLIAPDLAGSSMGVLAGYLFWRWLGIQSLWAACWAGLGLGLALLSKATFLVFGPAWILLWGVHRYQLRTCNGCWKREVGQLLLILTLSCYVLNLGYGFVGTCTPLKSYRFVSRMLAGNLLQGQVSSNRFQGTILGEVPVPVPRQFLRGLDLQKKDFESGRWSYLGGKQTWRGSWYFYLAAILMKSPLGYGVLLIIALSAIRRGSAVPRHSAALIALPGVAVIAFVSFEQGFACFVRYVLPALPFAIVLMGAAGHWIDSGSRVARCVVGLTLTWIAGSSLWCYPYSLSYCNELVSGSVNGYRYLSDSNIDWGQDLYFVQDWLKQHPECQPVTLAWNELLDPKIIGIDLPQTPSPAQVEESDVRQCSHNLFEGWHIVCVSALNASDQRYAYLRGMKTVDRIGYSVMVYHMDKEQAKNAESLFSPPLSPPKEP